MKLKDWTGYKFPYLRAIRRVRQDKSGHQVWLLRCPCGKKTERRIDNLLRYENK